VIRQPDSRCQYRSREHEGRQCLGAATHKGPHGGYLLAAKDAGKPIESWEEGDEYGTT